MGVKMRQTARLSSCRQHSNDSQILSPVMHHRPFPYKKDRISPNQKQTTCEMYRLLHLQKGQCRL